MKKQHIYRCSVLFVWLFAIQVQAQKESKTFRENFDVNKDVTVEVNTRHTDVEFETWDKNTVEVVATIVTDGISREEAEKYFKGWKFEATGNKNKVSVITRPGNVWMHYGMEMDSMDLSFVLPELPDIPEMPEIPTLSDIPVPPVPPMPPKVLDMTNLSFDYEAYRKDGDKYMEAWKEKWQKAFDEDFKKQMESWKEEMESHREKIMEEAKEIKIDREKMQEQTRKAREATKKIREKAAEARKKAIKNGKSVFYFYDNGKETEVNVKKRILIKMPKGAKLKINVRHGEVKLAENSENVRATLSHATLRAKSVDGRETSIETSYAPVLVQNWNGGKLQVNYVREVRLENVGNLELISNSSDVTVENLLHKGYIQGSFGKLQIDRIGDNFSRLDVVLDNTNAVIELPGSAFGVDLNGSNSEIVLPHRLKVSTSKEGNHTQMKGYHKKNDPEKQITLEARYSEVTFN
ncbi:hypothetical protein [Sinomicrobium weinanense]|uniref:Adhesin domain-containing protein n=1 Tax=Sinomicrobium weinanense TaxID=2842200 RepID=A0A926JSS4_9FLAO|nr:hypothetical protein [Sinomicrobium weinanense]MBC9796587.1 hypothetical protein [Sinomicrobium weinanense]MBU3123571.1 hypothetical protein [Sinomicrobium weinanense]